MRSCDVRECEKPCRGNRKVCPMHDARMRLTGTYDPGPKSGTPEERFWRRVNKGAEGGCWLWDTHGHSAQYGTIRVDGRQVFVHRFAYETLVGPIADGLVLDHKCRTRHCVNPDHLHPVTVKENAENLTGERRNNRSGIRGVSWDSTRQRWSAQVGHNGRNYCARFGNIEDAAAWVVETRLRLHTNNLLDRAS